MNKMKHEDIIIKARASISWIYSNLLGKKANFELLHPTELKRAEEEYVAWVSYLLPIEQAIEEFEDTKHNYDAVKEMHENSVAYATKLQNELNSSKETIAYLQGEIMRREHRILGLQHEVSKVRETTRPIRSSNIPNIEDRLRGMTVCEHCHTQIFDHRNHKAYNYCAGCGRKIRKE